MSIVVWPSKGQKAPSTAKQLFNRSTNLIVIGTVQWRSCTHCLYVDEHYRNRKCLFRCAIIDYIYIEIFFYYLLKYPTIRPPRAYLHTIWLPSSSFKGKDFGLLRFCFRQSSSLFVRTEFYAANVCLYSIEYLSTSHLLVFTR